MRSKWIWLADNTHRRVPREIWAFAAAQLIVQAVSMVIGILIVRTLSRADYAAYALALSVTSGAGVIAHSGFSSTILSRGAAVRHNRSRLSGLMATVGHYRRRVTLVVVALAGPTQYVLLLRIDTPPWISLQLTGVTVAVLIVMASVGVGNELLTLEYRRSELQRQALLVNVLRLVGQLLLMVTRTANSISVMMATLFATLLGRRYQERAIRQIIDRGVASVDDELILAKRSFSSLLASNVMIVFQGQLVYLLLAFFGHGGSLSDLSALMRFNVVLGVVGASVKGVMVPMVARAERDEVARQYGSVFAVTALICLTAGVVAIAATDILLGVLGPSYSHLGAAFGITVIVAACGCLADVVSSLNQARGWTSRSWVQVPATVMVAATVVYVVDVGTATGAALLTAAMTVAVLMVQTGIGHVGIRRLRRDRWLDMRTAALAGRFRGE